MKNKIIKRFVIVSITIFFLWKIVYHSFIEPDGRLNDALTNLVLKGTVYGLNFIGFESHHEKKVVFINDNSSVAVGNRCNGLELTALYVGFFLCFPGRIKDKLSFIIIGSILIFLLNIVREMALAINYNYFRESFDLNHKYTFALIVYFMVFLLWKKWINDYSFKANK